MNFKSLYLLLFGIFILCSCNNSGLKGDNNSETKDENNFNDSIALLREIEEQAKPAYIEAYKRVTELKMYVEMAENGQLNKNEVVADYNRRLGPEMGRLKTLLQVKQRLDTAGEAYIQFKFKKAQADIALSKAAEKDFIVNSYDSTKK